MHRLGLNRWLLNLSRFRRPFARQIACLAAVLTLASCMQSEKHETTMPAVDEEASLTYESLSKFVGKEWKLDSEVVNTLLTHPSFRNTPPVKAKFGKSLGEYGDERSEDTFEFVHLGQGWIEETSISQARGGSWTDYQSSGRVISLLAGLLPFATWIESTSTWEDDAPEIDLGGGRIIAIDSISGQIFPIEVGQSMTVVLVRSSWDFKQPERQSTPWEVPSKTSIKWEVTQIVDGRAVGLLSDEPVFEIINTVFTTFENPQDSRAHKDKFYYVASLGIALRSGQYSSEYPKINKRWAILE